MKKDVKSVEEQRTLKSRHAEIGARLQLTLRKLIRDALSGNKEAIPEFQQLIHFLPLADREHLQEYLEKQMEPAEEGVCCICGGQYTHGGNNPEPLASYPQRCCASCDNVKVIPERLRRITSKQN